MIEKVIAAFLYLRWIFSPESGDCDIGKRVTSMIEFGGINGKRQIKQCIEK